MITKQELEDLDDDDTPEERAKAIGTLTAVFFDNLDHARTAASKGDWEAAYQILLTAQTNMRILKQDYGNPKP